MCGIISLKYIQHLRKVVWQSIAIHGYIMSRKNKMVRLKVLYIVFLSILFLELLGSLGAIFFSDSAGISAAGFSNLFLVIITTIVVLMPWAIESRYDIDIPDFLEAILLFMLFVSVILGFLNDYYVNVDGFDKLTHTLSGITLSIIAFQTLYILNKSKSVTFKMSPIALSIFAYTFSITLLVIWEFYEFFIDTISFNISDGIARNMQRYQNLNTSLVFPQDYGLYDTMIDLVVGSIGALIVVVVGYLLIRVKKEKIEIK